MINFASKNEFKRANNASNAKKIFASKLPLIKQHDDIILQDDDTLMSADEMQSSEVPSSSMFPLVDQTTIGSPNTLENYQKSHPINIIGAIGSSLIQGSSSTSGVVADFGSSFNAASYSNKQPIESEMSGEKEFLSNLDKFMKKFRIFEENVKRVK